MRVLVLGCGGIGGIVAASMRAAGTDVTVVSRSAPVVAAVAAHGFRLHGVGGARTVPGPVADTLPDGPFDYVLLATQPPDLDAAAAQGAARLGPGGHLVTLPNGLPEERVAARTGRPVIGAIVGWGASHIAPGVFERTSRGGFVIGTPDGANGPAVTRLAALLAPIGPVTVSTNLRGARWSKLAINCAISAIGTLGGARLGVLLRDASVRQLALEVMTEATHVAAAEGVLLEPISGMVDLHRMALPARSRLGLWARHLVLLAVGLRYRRLRSSMLAALERGGRPPVDLLNGEVVRRGAAHGIPTPANEALTTHILALSLPDHPPGWPALRGLLAARTGGRCAQRGPAGAPRRPAE